MKINSINSGKYFSGVFCCVEGVLVKEGILFEEMYENLKDISLTKEIFLWIDVWDEELKNFLLGRGITWKLVSINDYFGSEVEIVFSKETYYTFQHKYEIETRSYNRVVF